MPIKYKVQPKDVFLQLGIIAALYTAAGSFLTLLFQIINYFFPDPLEYFFNPGGPMRWALATIVIVFPVLVWLSWAANKEIKENTAKADVRIRKWLIYLTLFLAAGIIIGDLITLMYNFLEGDLTTRFLLKVAAVLSVAGAVFWYYLHDLRRGGQDFSKWAKVFVWKIIIIILAAAVVGFYIAGSPFKQRDIKFDQERIGHLQTIQGQIVNYWIQKGKLPANLNDLIDTISGFVPPTDPETEELYPYQVIGAYSFKLCALFNLPSEEPGVYKTRPIGPYPIDVGIEGGSWEHGAGEQCFTRTIDPEIYKTQAVKR